MGYKYSTKRYDKENMARVVGRSLPISTKFSVEICRFIRNRTTSEAKSILQKVIDKKMAIPFKVFNKDLSHKRKIGPGRYPKKAAEEIMGLLESVEANAQFKGINTSDLCICHINAQLASRPWRYGRQRRRKAKRTHIEIVVEERKAKEKENKTKELKKPVSKSSVSKVSKPAQQILKKPTVKKEKKE